MHEVSFHDEPERRVAAIAHTGPYMSIGAAFAKAGELMDKAGGFQCTTGMIAVYHDDPKAKPAADLRSHAGFILQDGAHAPEGMETLELPSGRCAVLHHHGPYAGLADSYDWLQTVWLPGSGEVRAKASTFEIYQNTPEDTAPEDLVTVIYLPIEEVEYNGPV